MALTMDKFKAANPGWIAEVTSDGTWFRKGAWRFFAKNLDDAQEKIWEREPHRRPPPPEPPTGSSPTLEEFATELARPGF